MELPSADQRIFFERAASQYQTDLSGATNVQAYLTSRGIGARTAGTYRLGVVQNPLPSHEPFRGRLCIPYLTPSGVVTFAFRCLEDHVCKDTVLFQGPKGPVTCKKYRAPEGMERTLYNVADFKKDVDRIYICEGEIDTLTLSLCGFAAVGTPGVSQWKPQFTRCFADAGEIFCVADGDEAGRKMGRFLAAELKARVIRPPAGEDINSLYVKGGEDGVRGWLEGAAR